MMEIFQKINFYCCMMLTAQKIPIFPTKITSILTWKRVSMGLTVRRKTAKNLAVRRKNERILAVSRKKN